MKLTYLGHSAFEINTGRHKLLIDPFLIKTPNYNFSGVSDIFVTHAHSDHLGSAIEISKKSGATITAIFELANYCSHNGAKTNGINLGSFIEYPWGKAAAVPAFHSSSLPNGSYGGCPCGYVFKIENKVLYHAGDTCINSEIKTIGDVYKPDIAILPAGGFYTMNIEHAALASEWLGANNIIPMHYNTFEAINVNIQEFTTLIKNLGKTPTVMNIGENLEI